MSHVVILSTEIVRLSSMFDLSIVADMIVVFSSKVKSRRAFRAPLVLQTIARVLFSATQIYYKILKVYGGDITPWEIVSLVITAHAQTQLFLCFGWKFLLPQPRRLCFHPYLSVCLSVSVCQQDYSKTTDNVYEIL